MKYFLVVFLLLVFTNISLHAQKRGNKNRFSSGIIMGMNTSQINGDHYSGYDKFGGFAGFRAIARLTDSDEFVFEMQYNRKGSRDPEQFVPSQSSSRFIALDYIEVPILYHKRIKINLLTASIEGGIAYARLFGYTINENDNSINYSSFTDIQDEFNKDELALIIGGGVFVNEHIRIMGRFNYALTLLYKDENPNYELTSAVPEIYELRNMQLGLGVNYLF